MYFRLELSGLARLYEMVNWLSFILSHMSRCVPHVLSWCVTRVHHWLNMILGRGRPSFQCKVEWFNPSTEDAPATGGEKGKYGP